MPRHKSTRLQEVEESLTDNDDENLGIDESDFGFIVSSDGKLKLFFCAEDFNGLPPKEVIKILKLFKITDYSNLLPNTLPLH
jgi:hypothetical protein